MNKDELNNILEEHNLWLDSSGAKGKRANLKEVDLRWSNLKGADLRRCNLRWCDLKGANLMGADLRAADLKEADLRWCNLRAADLKGANLEGANLEEACLEGANLREADLEGACLEGAKLDGANLKDIKGKEIISFQAGRHFAYYADGYITIVCMTEAVDWWLENYKAVGRAAYYSEAEIKDYGFFIYYVANRSRYV